MTRESVIGRSAPYVGRRVTERRTVETLTDVLSLVAWATLDLVLLTVLLWLWGALCVA